MAFITFIINIIHTHPFGGNMSWGHATSRDLIHWEHQPVALRGDILGAIFSGSCIVDKSNASGFGKDAVIAYYTSASERQMQSMAVSRDNGLTFEKYEGNPIITSTANDFRDPKVVWNEKCQKLDNGFSRRSGNAVLFISRFEELEV